MTNSLMFTHYTRQQVVRMVQEQNVHYASQWQAIVSIAAKVGRSTETVRRWVRQHERDVEQYLGLSRAERRHLQDLEREVIELRKANEILRAAAVGRPLITFERRFRP